MRYLTVRKFSGESGYSEAAVRSKIQGGVWLKGEVWRHAPDGRVLIDVEGYEAWVENGKPSATQVGAPSSTSSPALQKTFVGSPPPLI